MVWKYLIRFLFRLYLESVDFLMSLQPQPSRNPITDISGPTPIDTYMVLLELAIQLADKPLELLTESRVTRVRSAKEAEHEYTLAEVSMGSEDYYFRIERKRGAQSQQTVEELMASNDPELAEYGKMVDNIVQQYTQSPRPTSEAEPYVSSAKSVASLNVAAPKLGMSLRPADDLIQRVSSFDPPAPDIILHDIYPENLTWLEFILIANLVHTENKIYSVFASQCYWFTHLIFLLVQAKFCRGDTEKGPASESYVHISRRLSHPDPRQRYIKIEQSKSGRTPGTWMSILVSLVDLPLLEKLQSKFNSRWNETRQKIESLAEKKANTELLKENTELLETEIRILKEKLAAAELREKQHLKSQDHQFRVPTTGDVSSSLLVRNPDPGTSTALRGSGRRSLYTWTGSQRFVSLRSQPLPVNRNTGLDRLGLGLLHLFKIK